MKMRILLVSAAVLAAGCGTSTAVPSAPDRSAVAPDEVVVDESPAVGDVVPDPSVVSVATCAQRQDLGFVPLFDRETGLVRVDLSALSPSDATTLAHERIALDVMSGELAPAPHHSDGVDVVELSANVAAEILPLLGSTGIAVLPYSSNLRTRATTYPERTGLGNTAVLLIDGEVRALGDDPDHRCGVLRGLALAYARSRGEQGSPPLEVGMEAALFEFADQLATNQAALDAIAA